MVKETMQPSHGSKSHDHALNLTDPSEKWEPRKVILFSGHMIDTPQRQTPRFPAEKVQIAAKRINEELEKMDAGPEDLALTQGACGADILFTEVCLQRGVKVHWLQPFDEADFIRKSVAQCGETWKNRYNKIRPKLAVPILSAPDTLGPPPKNASQDYAYVRCNLWLLSTAMTYGSERVNFICLWDGEGGDSSGGTAHMYNEVSKRKGRVFRIDSHSL
ncbi:MAG: hypothetical protein ABW139_16570 [Candidatus Thiodiazotropha sp. DIVDIV]